jgi:hypothetical protein
MRGDPMRRRLTGVVLVAGLGAMVLLGVFAVLIGRIADIDLEDGVGEFGGPQGNRTAA